MKQHKSQKFTKKRTIVQELRSCRQTDLTQKETTAVQCTGDYESQSKHEFQRESYYGLDKQKTK